ncbi:MAG: hypothetical protein VX498_08160 [Myxococcota bacterium]|nr:hypothetical protein [Myxococcota bacterium]
MRKAFLFSLVLLTACSGLRESVVAAEPSPVAESVKQVQQLVSQAEAEGFESIEGFGVLPDGSSVAEDSRGWCHRIFAEGVSPWREGSGAERSVRRGSGTKADLLRHHWSSGEHRLELVESIEWLFLRVQPKDGGAPASWEEARRWLDAVLRTKGVEYDSFGQERPYELGFRFEGPVTDGAGFSTPKTAPNELTESWTDRVDGTLERGGLSLLVHKRRSQSSGRLIFLDSKHWFDGQAWESYRAP